MDNMKIENNLTSIPETMLITLWAKGTEYNHPDPIIRDPKAAEIMEMLDYDFSKLKSAKMSQVGCCVRASLIDDEVRTFLSIHPDAVVIQLGAGIDARYERLGCPPLTHWYDLDLPSGIEFRRQVLKESDKNTFVAQSLFDYSWIDRVQSHGKPVLIVIEGVLMYFAPEEVRAFFTEICERFDSVSVIFDMLAYVGVGHSKQHDALRKYRDQDISFKWSELNTKDMETWHPNLHVAAEYYMSKYDRGRYPWIIRMLYKLPYFYRRFNQRIVRIEIH